MQDSERVRKIKRKGLIFLNILLNSFIVKHKSHEKTTLNFVAAGM
jgi:hypothetical protein